MTSQSFDDLSVALGDVDSLLQHAQSFAGGKRGAPKSRAGVARPGRPFTRAATVMLAGALEAYLESLALETGKYLNLTAQQSQDLKILTSNMHGISVGKIHGLYATLGCPFILDDFGWKGLPKGTVRSRLSQLHKARNQIAHGNAPEAAQVAKVQSQRVFVESLSKVLEKATAERISQVTGKVFSW